MSKKHKSNAKNIIQNSLQQSSFIPFAVGGGVDNILCGGTLNQYLTNNLVLISNMWQKNWIAKSVIELPVKDAFKEAPKPKTDLISEEEMELVYREFESKIYSKLLHFFYHVRAFGTAFLIIMPKGFKDGKVSTISPNTALTLNEITNAKEIEFEIASPYEMYDLFALRNYYSLTDAKYINEECPYFFQGISFHKSRVIKMITAEPPKPTRSLIYTGGGISILEDIKHGLEQYEIMRELTLTMVNEAKLDVFLKTGYDSAVEEGNEGALKRNFQSAMQNRNFNTTIVMDKNTTEYQQKQLNLSNLHNLMDVFQASCFIATGIPMKRLGALTSNGFSDSDKTAEQNYNKTLTFVRNWGKEAILMLYKICFLRTLEYIPEDLDIEFPSLDVLTEIEKQKLKTENLENLLKLSDKVQIPADDLLEVVRNLKIFDTKMDFAVDNK